MVPRLWKSLSLKPPSPREVGRRAILRRVGRSVALCGACFQRHAVPAAEAAEDAEDGKAKSKTKPKVNPPPPACGGSPLGEGAF